MLRNSAVALAGLAVLCGGAQAQGGAADRKAEAENFFNALCTETDKYHGTCEEEQRDFVSDYQKAFRGEYTPQRNVGFMLYTGSGGAIRKNPIQACAWRMVVLQSGHPQLDTGDTANADLACKRLSASERTAAAARTVAIMGEIAAGKGRR